MAHVSQHHKKTRIIAVAALVAGVLGLGVAFAALSTTLLINGQATIKSASWDIYWDSLQCTPSGEAQVSSSTISQTATLKDTVNINANFTANGDKVVCTLVAKNDGSLDAEEKHQIEMTRSRPHKKNDNCFIEQRNNVVVRKYLGYERYDCQAAVIVMNQLYAVLRLYVNFFQPSFRLESKVSYSSLGIQRKGQRRIYDQPAAPYARVLALPDEDFPGETLANKQQLARATKQRLRLQYETLNPARLKSKIEILTIKLERVQRELGYHY
ncbi:MAG: hypothetical protein LBQ02_03355 [Candidatus Nomurabacteria bacterium]|jgi:hypothetical protein|nr:hypothetical protein [Candidatus Nomurabacteria bacterium]